MIIEVDLLPGSRRPRGGGPLPATGAGRFGWLGRGRGLDPGLALLLAVWLAASAAAAILWLAQRSEAAALQTRLREAAADSARLAGIRTITDSIAAQVAEIQGRVALVEQLDGDRFVWPRIMDQLSRALPQSAWLVSIRQLSSAPDVSIEVRGVAASPIAITEFAQALEASEHLSGVKIAGSQKQSLDAGEIARQDFALTVGFDKGGQRRRTARANGTPD